MKLLLVLAVMVFSVLVAATAIRAQDAAVPQTAATVAADDVNTVAKELWCPLCSGVRLDACELRACDQMKDVIAQKLAAGEDTQEIKDYFVQQYGPQVLGEPPMEGFNWLAWLLPIAAVVGGGVFVWQMARRMVHRPQPADANGEHAATDTADPYAQKLEQELKQYD